MNIDHNLVSTLTSLRWTAVLATNGLYTRMSMVYWALQGKDVPLIVTPKIFHAWIKKELERSEWRINDEVREVRLITSESLLSKQPDLPDRTMFEMNNYGVTQKQFVKRLALERKDCVIRVLHGRRQDFALYARSLGYECISYTLQPDTQGNHNPVIRIMT